MTAAPRCPHCGSNNGHHQHCPTLANTQLARQREPKAAPAPDFDSRIVAAAIGVSADEVHAARFGPKRDAPACPDCEPSRDAGKRRCMTCDLTLYEETKPAPISIGCPSAPVVDPKRDAPAPHDCSGSIDHCYVCEPKPAEPALMYEGMENDTFQPSKPAADERPALREWWLFAPKEGDWIICTHKPKNLAGKEYGEVVHVREVKS